MSSGLLLTFMATHLFQFRFAGTEQYWLIILTFTNQVLAQLDLLRNWKESTAYKNDLHLLPKETDRQRRICVSRLHLPAHCGAHCTRCGAHCPHSGTTVSSGVKVGGPHKRGVFLLTGVIAVVLLRTLRRDSLKYNKLAAAEGAAETRAGNSFTLTCSGNHGLQARCPSLAEFTNCLPCMFKCYEMVKCASCQPGFFSDGDDVHSGALWIRTRLGTLLNTHVFRSRARAW